MGISINGDVKVYNSMKGLGINGHVKMWISMKGISINGNQELVSMVTLR